MKAHAPESEADLDHSTKPRARLAYDELFANQLAVALVRAHQRRLAGRPLKGDGRLRAKALAALPFALTRSQEAAVRDILADMAGETRMLRLLQGDVGSGKTIVAFLALLNAVEAGAQGVLMAPTEILARQHFQSMAPLAQAAGVRLALLTGRDKGKPREVVLAGLKDGSIEIAIGTHALFQEEVAFKNIAIAVVDEQHRFGVHQRLLLASKGRVVNMLVMTATPIPRTLMLAAYGDMDVSLPHREAGGPQADRHPHAPLAAPRGGDHGTQARARQGRQNLLGLPARRGVRGDRPRRRDRALSPALRHLSRAGRPRPWTPQGKREG